MKKELINDFNKYQIMYIYYMLNNKCELACECLSISISIFESLVDIYNFCGADLHPIREYGLIRYEI